MNLYAIRRRDGWATPEDLQAAAARSAELGDKPGSGVRWIRSYVVAEESGDLGTVCIYEAESPEAIRAHAERVRHARRRDHAGRRHRDRAARPGSRRELIPTRRRPSRPPAGPRLQRWPAGARSWGVTSNAGGSWRRCTRRGSATARSCSWRARPAWERRASPPSWPRARTRSCCGAAPARGRGALRPRRRRAAHVPAGVSGRPRRLRPAPRPPGAAAPRARRPGAGERPGDAVRGGARRARAPRPRAGSSCSCSTTCSGPTTRRSSCFPRSRSRSATCRCSRSPPTAPTACRATTRCAACARASPPRAPGRAGAGAARAGETAELLARILGDAPAPSLARTVHDRTQGLPFFVEELARALLATGALTRAARPRARRGRRGAGAGHGPRRGADERLGALGATRARRPRPPPSPGSRFDLEFVGAVSTAGGLAELLERGAGRRRTAWARAAFRHALTREALYADVPWLQRRALHRRLAEALEAGGGNSREVATHWLGARDEARARDALCCARPRSRGPSTRTATPPGPGARRSSCGRTARTQEGRIEALDAYAALRRARRRAGRGGRAWRELCAILAARDAGERLAARPAPARRRPRASRATASRRSPRGGPPPRRTRPPACPPRPRSSASRWPTSCASPPHHGAAIELAQRGRPRGRARRSGSTCAPGRSGSRASRWRKRGDFEGGLADRAGRARRWRSSTA